LPGDCARRNTRPDDFVVGTAEGHSVQERNLRRALDGAKSLRAWM
jgi:hypothetical protein